MFTNAFRPVKEMFKDMKLWKFKVEGISGENIFGHHLRVGILNVKWWFNDIQKYF